MKRCPAYYFLGLILNLFSYIKQHLFVVWWYVIYTGTYAKLRLRSLMKRCPVPSVRVSCGTIYVPVLMFGGLVISDCLFGDVYFLPYTANIPYLLNAVMLRLRLEPASRFVLWCRFHIISLSNTNGSKCCMPWFVGVPSNMWKVHNYCFKFN